MKNVSVSEVERICNMIRSYVRPEEKIVLGVSGGIDSDVAARLCVKALSPDRVHLFYVLQEGVPARRLDAVKMLAKELHCMLGVIDLREMNTELVLKVHASDSINLNPNSLMDFHRAKCALRVAIYSIYNENDFVFCSTTNRTEYETGSCMLWGDMLGHLRPLIHLYKTQVYELARLVGTSETVLHEPPSADFWEGEDDMDDLSYMLLNRSQVPGYRRFSLDEMEEAAKIKKELSLQRLDLALEAFHSGMDPAKAAFCSGLPKDIAEALECLVRNARITRARIIMKSLEPME